MNEDDDKLLKGVPDSEDSILDGNPIDEAEGKAMLDDIELKPTYEDSKVLDPWLLIPMILDDDVSTVPLRELLTELLTEKMDSWPLKGELELIPIKLDSELK